MRHRVNGNEELNWVTQRVHWATPQGEQLPGGHEGDGVPGRCRGTWGALGGRGAPGHSVKLEPGGAGRASGPIAGDPARCVGDLVLRTVENRGESETSEFGSRRILWLNIGERMEMERPEARRAVSSYCDLSGQGWRGPEMRPPQWRGGRRAGQQDVYREPPSGAGTARHLLQPPFPSGEIPRGSNLLVHWHITLFLH